MLVFFYAVDISSQYGECIEKKNAQIHSDVLHYYNTINNNCGLSQSLCFLQVDLLFLCTGVYSQDGSNA